MSQSPRPRLSLPRFPRTGLRWRGLQLLGLSLAGLLGGGYLLLSGSGGPRPLRAGEVPQFTVLLAGRDVVYCYYRQPCKDQDQRTGLYQTPNTDTLMLVKVSGSGVDILNIPRDTNVGEFDPEQPAPDQKINSRYWSGGPAALTRAAEEVTGERVDSYVIVRTDYVARVISALGGLDVTVPEGGVEWVDQAAGVDLKLPAGEHHLGGEQAMWYLRVRKGFGDDYGRIDHQKQALTQLVARLKTPQGLAALPTILGGVGQGVETNVDPAVFTALLPHLSGLKLRFATLPTDTIPGTFNLAVNRERLAQVWGADQTPASLVALPPVKVWDSSGAGLGRGLREALLTIGYPEVSLTELPRSGEASQVFTQGQVSAATLLADTLGLPRLQGERFPVSEGEVGILLGTDAADSLAALKAAYPASTALNPATGRGLPAAP